MNLPYELLIGLTYTRAGRRGRRKDRFLSFISGMSIASIALGVAALIIVLSVMNGFQKDVRDRMLSVIPHMEVISMEGGLKDWKALAQKAQAHKDVLAAAPFVDGQGLLSVGSRLQGALIKGVDPTEEPKVSEVAQNLLGGDLTTLEPGRYHMVIGRDLARQLGVGIGQKVALMVPQGSMSPAGMVPRIKQFTVTGYLASGHYQYDSGMAFINLKDAAKLFKTGGADGIRLKLADRQEADAVGLDLARTLASENVYVRPWTTQNATWFAAVQVEKRMMGIILFLIVLVGAFGLVSSLVMTVKEKQADIAILRTVGASRGSILRIFVIQGTIIGIVGVTVGVGLGLLVAYNVGSIVSFIEHLFGVQFLPQQIYFISQMPSDPRMGDVIPIALFSFILSLVATLYPSWRAAQTQPAEALRYE